VQVEAISAGGGVAAEAFSVEAGKTDMYVDRQIPGTDADVYFRGSLPAVAGTALIKSLIFFK
jgi:hypothetical protein